MHLSLPKAMMAFNRLIWAWALISPKFGLKTGLRSSGQGVRGSITGMVLVEQPHGNSARRIGFTNQLHSEYLDRHLGFVSQYLVKSSTTRGR